MFQPMKARIALVMLAALCMLVAAPSAASARPVVKASFAIPVIFEGDTPDLRGLISDRRPLGRVRIVWGQGTTSTWRWQDNPSENLKRITPMEVVGEDFYYMQAGTYTVRIIATDRRGGSTTKTLRLTVEAYSPEREAQLCALYGCGAVDPDPEVGPEGV